MIINDTKQWKGETYCALAGGGVQSNSKISAFASIGCGGETEKDFCALSCFPGHILEFHGDASLGEVVGCGEVVGTHTW